jgi:hypothetical protein
MDVCEIKTVCIPKIPGNGCKNGNVFISGKCMRFDFELSLMNFQYKVTIKKLRNQFGYGAIKNSIE